jgi:sulfotransferase family protein
VEISESSRDPRPVTRSRAGVTLPVEDRLAFVGGLHRSGTTPIAGWLSDHPDVSGLRDTGVFADEGQHLQTVYPIASVLGGAGRFALSADARQTEDSPLVTPGASGALLAAWTPYWDTSKAVLLEKSPPNLIRMRFLHALFPAARFVVVIRHPIAVTFATKKWTHATLNLLLRHWVAAHEHVVDDAGRIGSVALVRYEDVMARPDQELGKLFAFLGLPPHSGRWPVDPELNQAYLRRWCPPSQPWRRWLNHRLAMRYETAVRPFGYSLRDPMALRAPEPAVAALLAP